jgi:ribosome-binding protein aMBF1 (putative translation factor)
MSISWPVAAIVVALVIIIGMIIMGTLSSRPGSLSRSRISAQVAKEEVQAQHAEQYRTLAADYETLAREMRDATSAIRSDLATMLERVDSIERMIREVG